MGHYPCLVEIFLNLSLLRQMVICFYNSECLLDGGDVAPLVAIMKCNKIVPDLGVQNKEKMEQKVLVIGCAFGLSKNKQVHHVAEDY